MTDRYEGVADIRSRRAARCLAACAFGMMMSGVVASGTGAGAGAEFDQELERWQRSGLPSSTAERRELLGKLRGQLPPGDRQRELALLILECRDPVEPEPFLLRIEQGLKTRESADAERLQLLDCAGHLQEPLRSPAAAIASYTEGIALARALKQDATLISLLGFRSGTLSQTGEHALALQDALEAYRLTDAKGGADFGDTLLNIGIAYRRIGDLELAAQYLERSRQQSERLDRWTSLVDELLQLGYVNHDQGKLDAAKTLFQQVKERSAARDDWPSHAAAMLGLAMGDLKASRHAEALQAAQAARESFDRAGIVDHMPELLRGQALAGLGRHDEASRLFDAVHKAWAAAGHKRYLAILLKSRAETAAALGRHAAAFADLQQYVALREEQLQQQADQRTQWMRHQFDASQREQKIASLQAARRWQYLALALSALLMMALMGLAIRWRLRSRRYRNLALTDTLTGVANRRRVERYAESCLDASQLGQHAVSLVIFDIDHFKRVNDQHGHAAGDQVIRRVAQIAQQQLREGDLLGRIGGEEFLMVLPGTGGSAARIVAERVRVAVQELDFSDVHPTLKVTISLGLAAAGPTEHRELTQWLEIADAALYKAKQGGRNQTQG